MTVEEFNTSVEEYSDRIYRFVYKSVRDQEKARDIVQDTFEKLWKNRFQINSHKIKAYTFSVAYHTMIDMMRRENRKVDYEEVDTSGYSYSTQYPDLSEILNKAINRLPEKQRHVVLLRDYEGYTYKEIGEVTGMNESQVKVYIYRARLTLKKFIGSMHTVI